MFSSKAWVLRLRECVKAGGLVVVNNFGVSSDLFSSLMDKW